MRPRVLRQRPRPCPGTTLALLLRGDLGFSADAYCARPSRDERTWTIRCPMLRGHARCGVAGWVSRMYRNTWGTCGAGQGRYTCTCAVGGVVYKRTAPHSGSSAPGARGFALPLECGAGPGATVLSLSPDVRRELQLAFRLPESFFPRFFPPYRHAQWQSTPHPRPPPRSFTGFFLLIHRSSRAGCCSSQR